jgi:hypothetical protein
MKILVTIYWKDQSKSETVVPLIEAIEMELAKHPDVFDLRFQVWKNDDKKNT